MKQLFKSKKGYGRYQHITIALIVLIILYYLNFTYKWIEVSQDNFILLQLLAVGALWSILPDSDQEGSIANKIVITSAVIIILYAFYNPIYQIYGVISAVVILLLRWIEHRTIIHSIIGALIISAPLFYLSTLHFIVGFIAYITHLIADGEMSLFAEKDWF